MKTLEQTTIELKKAYQAIETLHKDVQYWVDRNYREGITRLHLENALKDYGFDNTEIYELVEFLENKLNLK